MLPSWDRSVKRADGLLYLVVSHEVVTTKVPRGPENEKGILGDLAPSMAPSATTNYPNYQCLRLSMKVSGVACNEKSIDYN